MVKKLPTNSITLPHPRKSIFSHIKHNQNVFQEVISTGPTDAAMFFQCEAAHRSPRSVYTSAHECASGWRHTVSVRALFCLWNILSGHQCALGRSWMAAIETMESQTESRTPLKDQEFWWFTKCRHPQAALYGFSRNNNSGLWNTPSAH